jgi:hypothetical protein
VLRQADGRPGARAQCSWCEDIELSNDVVFFSAKRSGEARRNGNTVGTLVCDKFQCAINARKRPAVAYIGIEPTSRSER